MIFKTFFLLLYEITLLSNPRTTHVRYMTNAENVQTVRLSVCDIPNLCGITWRVLYRDVGLLSDKIQ